MSDINELRHTRRDQMDSLISRLQRPGYDLQKEQAIQEAIVVLQQLNAERDTMRAKIEAMERQEPVAWRWELKTGQYTYVDKPEHAGKNARVVPLYALPGAQPAPSEPSDEYVGWYCAHCERGVDASEVTYHEQHQACGRVITDDRPPKASVRVPGGWKLVPSVPDGWREAAVAWEVCASIHREYARGKDPFFSTRQKDFEKHANDARAMLAAAPEAKP